MLQLGSVCWCYVGLVSDACVWRNVWKFVPRCFHAIRGCNSLESNSKWTGSSQFNDIRDLLNKNIRNTTQPCWPKQAAPNPMMGIPWNACVMFHWKTSESLWINHPTFSIPRSISPFSFIINDFDNITKVPCVGLDASYRRRVPSRWTP